MSKIWLLIKENNENFIYKGLRKDRKIEFIMMQFKTNGFLWNRTEKGGWRSWSNTVIGRMLNMKMLVSYQLERNVFLGFAMRENI